ncbi:putative lysosomal cystine transporter [Helianthus debilis subsp. tardiflorus]
MSSWNSTGLEVLSNVFGWIAFVAWSISFYPQVLLNYRRKSVVGLNFDFVVLNLTKHSSYLIYNVSVYFSSAVQRQYYKKYGSKQMIPVAANDVAFSSHAVLLTAFTLFQIAIYDVSIIKLMRYQMYFRSFFELCKFKKKKRDHFDGVLYLNMQRGSQMVSKITIAIVTGAWTIVAICVVIAIQTHSWLWLVSCFNMLQVSMTAIKYIPQAIMNFKRKSTAGFSIGNILLDLLGGLTNYGQMAVQSFDQHSWVNFFGNIGKTLLSLVSIFFDVLFIVQHYLLYPKKKPERSPSPDPVNHVSLVTSSQHV